MIKYALETNLLYDKVDEIRDFYYDNNQMSCDVSDYVIEDWLNEWNRSKANVINQLGLETNQLKYEFNVEVSNSLGEGLSIQDIYHTLLRKILTDSEIVTIRKALNMPSDVYIYTYFISRATKEDFSVIQIENKKGNLEKRRLLKLLQPYISKESFIKIDKFIAEQKEARGLSRTKSTETVVISIDPIDFIQASYNTSGGWRSCFALDGEYHASTNAYMRTEDVAICYILDRDGKKKHRQWILLGNNYFSKGKSYPKENPTLNKAITKHLKSLYSRGNFFSYHKDHRVLIDSRGTYTDRFNTWWYKNNEPSDIYLCDGENCEGEEPYDCGYFSNEGAIYCEVCDNMVSEDDTYWSDYHDICICNCCIEDYRYCEDVGTYVHLDESIYLEDRNFWVSEGCDDILYCEDENITIDTSYTDYVEDFCYSYSYATLEHAQYQWYYITDEDAYTVDNSSLYTDEDGNYYYYEENVPKVEEE